MTDQLDAAETAARVPGAAAVRSEPTARSRRPWTAEDKAELLALFEASELSKAEFCREMGVPEATFALWRRQARATRQPAAPAAAAAAVTAEVAADVSDESDMSDVRATAERAAALAAVVARVIAAGRQHWEAADARVLVAAWRASGQTLRAFAGQQGICRRRLGQWAKRLGAAAADDGAPEADAVTFHPVRVRPPSEERASSAAAAPSLGSDHRGERRRERDHAAPLDIVLRDGAVIRVPYEFAADHLRRVLDVLATTSAGANGAC